MEATKTDLKNKYGELLRAAFKEPVIITGHGKPSHVLLTYEHYMELKGDTEKKETQDKT